MVHTLPADFLLSDGQHLSGDIYSHNLLRIQAEGRDGKICCAGCHIQNAAGLQVQQRVDGFLPPVKIHPPAQQVVQQVIAVRDGVEQGTDVVFFQGNSGAVMSTELCVECRRIRKVRNKGQISNLDFLTLLPYSECMNRNLLVRLPGGKDRTYPVLIEPGLLKKLPTLLNDRWKGRALFVVTDTNVGRLYGRAVKRRLQRAGRDVTLIEIPAGEKSKSIDMYHALLTALLENHVRRSSVVVALGGGVVGDLAGFAAATALRGVTFVQVPTSLLAQVDSSVGGKVGIDHQLGKNLIGAFFQPSLVIIDPAVLKTLPAAEFRNGIAEIVKIAAALDKRFFALLERRAHQLKPANVQLLTSVIATSVGLKAAVVMKDEQEAGLRKALNLGHTFGHALEAASKFRLRHGEAVAAGMILEGRIAVTTGLLPLGEFRRLQRLLDAVGLPTRLPSGLNVKSVLDHLALDKKADADGPLFVLPKIMGMSAIDVPVPVRLIRSVLV